MSNSSKPTPSPLSLVLTASFGEHYQQSGQFDAIFKEGMTLVERTAAYLDGAGRREGKKLKGAAAVAYATESMRLTTRLLELASWLLIRRAVRDGDITEEEAHHRRQRVKLGSTGRPSHIKHWADLPEDLRNMIEASFALQDRIMQLDRAFDVDRKPAQNSPQRNPVAAQLARLETAFGERLNTTDLN